MTESNCQRLAPGRVSPCQSTANAPEGANTQLSFSVVQRCTAYPTGLSDFFVTGWGLEPQSAAKKREENNNCVTESCDCSAIELSGPRSRVAAPL